jgi:hypothetical protein
MPADAGTSPPQLPHTERLARLRALSSRVRKRVSGEVGPGLAFWTLWVFVLLVFAALAEAAEGSSQDIARILAGVCTILAVAEQLLEVSREQFVLQTPGADDTDRWKRAAFRSKVRARAWALLAAALVGVSFLPSERSLWLINIVAATALFGLVALLISHRRYRPNDLEGFYKYVALAALLGWILAGGVPLQISVH